MTLNVKNRLLAIEQSSTEKVNKKLSTAKRKNRQSVESESGSRLQSIANTVSGKQSKTQDHRSFASGYFAHEWSVNASNQPSANNTASFRAPIAEAMAQPLQPELIYHQMSMRNGTVQVDAQMTAQPLQAMSQSSFFDDFDAINEAQPQQIDSPERISDEQPSLRISEQPQQSLLRAQPQQETEPVTETRLQTNTQAHERDVDQQEQATLRSPVISPDTSTNSDDDFMAELDSITAMSKSRSSKKMPKQFSGEVDAFQKELDAMVGKPSSSSSPNSDQAKPNEDKNNDASPYKGTSAGLSNHSVFDRLATNRPYANSFNLGTVNVGDRFDQFDVELDREEARTQTQIASDLGLSDVDVIADLSEISETAQPQDGAVNSTQPEQQTPASTPAETKPAETKANTQQTNYRVPVIMANEHITPWAAGAAMLVAWQGQWQVDNIEAGEGPWAEFAPLLANTNPAQLPQWHIETLSSPSDVNGWKQLLSQRGPLLLGDTEQVLVLTKLANDTNLIRVDQGAMQVAFEDFEELLARLQLSDAFVVAALVNDQSQIGQA